MTIIYSGGDKQVLELNQRMLDIACPNSNAKVEIEIGPSVANPDAWNIWVNFQGVCILRIQGVLRKDLSIAQS